MGNFSKFDIFLFDLMFFKDRFLGSLPRGAGASSSFLEVFVLRGRPRGRCCG